MKKEILIEKLLAYGKFHLGISSRDEIYFRNYLMHEFDVAIPYEGEINLDEIKAMEVPDSLVREMNEYFTSLGLDEKQVETKVVEIMGALSPLPSVVNDKFNYLANLNPSKATDYLYDLSIKNDYVKKSKIAQNQTWLENINGVELELSINLSKPEKDNKDIKKALLAKLSQDNINYPNCMICIENEGCFGSKKTPPRQNLRMIKFNLNNENWYLQYSPYGYFNEHSILIDEHHEKMKVSRRSIAALLEFVSQMPHYFIGSNSDLPIVGGSILTHEHFQGGNHITPIRKASIKEVIFDGEVKVSLLNFPDTTFVVESKDKELLINSAMKIIDKWHDYTNNDINIIANDGEQHNTCTAIVEKRDEMYRIYIVPRNNLCTPDRPDGLYHVRPSLQFIKKEGIGILEVSGLFVLPARLKRQLGYVDEIIKDPSIKDNMIKQHDDLIPFTNMIDEVLTRNITSHQYVGEACYKMLEDISAFKNDEVGQAALHEFIKTIKF